MAAFRRLGSSSSTIASRCSSAEFRATDPLLVGSADLGELGFLFGGCLVGGGLGFPALRAGQRGARVGRRRIAAVAVQVELHLAVVVCAVIGRDEWCCLRT